ncbi:HEPN domain-containing protein [Flavobacterium silvisoli]|uniref:HEPN domain-containing protein n=1 Tax=Flavobacterium silvisoli TaxID=2529433 RepID=UPI001386F937|nr:HEPN domain-containing protein [Flavobacterium silvisoli]
MSFLKEKSTFNLEAAKVLIDDYDNYAPSVHCSYYGAFQFISSTLNKLGETYEKVSNDIAASKGTSQPLASHEYPIKLISDKLSQKADVFYANTVKNKIKELKTFRRISDYDNVQITYEEGKKALALSNEIISLIKIKFP